MKFAAVVNTFAPDFTEQAGKIMHFIRESGLAFNDGILIVCSRSQSDAVCIAGFSRTIHITAELCMPQTVARYIKDNLADADLFITPGNLFGSELAVHIGSMLKGTSLNGVTSIEFDPNADNGSMTACRRIYANHVSGRFAMQTKPFCISIDNAFSSEEITVEQTILESAEVQSEGNIYRDLKIEPRETPADLDSADCVVIGGNGIGNRKNAEEMVRYAASADMIAAGSRPCVMNAWLPMNRMIGVSGRMIHPKISILLGISGSPAFYEGVKNSGRIIAVNKDPDAPISKKADLMITGDCIEVFRKFTEKYTKHSGRCSDLWDKR